MKTKLLVLTFISSAVIVFLSVMDSSTKKINFAGKALYGNKDFSQKTIKKNVIFIDNVKKKTDQECDVPSKPENLTGPSSMCAGATYTFKTTPVNGATSYEWELPLGWAGISTTTSMTAIAGDAGGDILVRAINDCGSSKAKHFTAMLSSSPPVPVIMTDGDILVSDASFGNQWYFESNPVKDAIEKTFTPVETGKYHVCVTNRNSCTSCSSPKEPSQFASISEEADAEENDGLIFPNPSNGIFTIKSKRGDSFMIYNSNGELIFTQKMEEDEVLVDFTWKPKGSYWVEFHSGSSVLKRKIIIY